MFSQYLPNKSQTEEALLGAHSLGWGGAVFAPGIQIFLSFLIKQKAGLLYDNIL